MPFVLLPSRFYFSDSISFPHKLISPFFFSSLFSASLLPPPPLLLPMLRLSFLLYLLFPPPSFPLAVFATSPSPSTTWPTLAARSPLISMPPPVFPLPFPSTYPLSFVFLSLLSSIPFPLFYHPASSSLSQFHYLIGMAVCHEHFLTAVCKVSPPNKCLYLLTPPTLPLSPPGWSNSCLVVCLILIHFKPVEKPQQHSQEWVVWDS